MNDQTITLPFDVALPPVTALRAGSLMCIYELGNLRTIQIGNAEVVRMIYAAVRDETWATAPYQIENEKIETTEQTFSITYTAFYKLADIRYKADFEITGSADNTITVNMRGEALSYFERNRIGLCVLHPIKEYAGKEAVVTKADGTVYNALFPKHISPHQPFLDIAQLQYSVDGNEVLLQFEGDIFGTEDQRNWTDGSFKTYSTPLRLPFPVAVATGERIAQRVTLRVTSGGASSHEKTESRTEISEQKIAIPKIGFCRRPSSPRLDEHAIELLKKVPFHHYRITLDLSNVTWKEEWQRGAAEAAQLNAQLELVVFFSTGSDSETADFIQHMKNQHTQIFSILILQKGAKATPQYLMQKCYEVLKQTFSNVHIGWGTDGNFADLNRARPNEAPHDFVSFSLYPQVHASDIRSIIENLETQYYTLQTIQTFTQQPVHISPITFAGRHVNTSDARQQTAFAAWWTLKALHNLNRAHSITFFEVTGPNGLLQPDDISGELKPTPIYDLFAQLAAFAPVWAIEKTGAQEHDEPVVFENSAGRRLYVILADKVF